MKNPTSMREQLVRADARRIELEKSYAADTAVRTERHASGSETFWSELRDLVEYESSVLANTYDKAVHALVWPYFESWRMRDEHALALQLERDWEWLYREKKPRAAPVAPRIDEYS